MVAGLRGGRLQLGPGVTFLVGDNGSGKSTLLEAVAVATGLNAEGGSRSFRFATRSSESSLHEAIRIGRAPGRERDSFFLRAESYYNVATEIERLDREDGGGPPIVSWFGGTYPHERSHGESFLDLLTRRLRPKGLYLLDEPESALSFRGCLAAIARIHALAEQGSQFLVATHSPVLLAVPGAQILQIGTDGVVAPVGYDEAMPVWMTRRFLGDPAATLGELLR